MPAKNEAKDKSKSLKNRAIYLPADVDKAFNEDADRCGRSFVKHVEALIVTYLEVRDVELRNISSVRESMKKGAKKDDTPRQMGYLDPPEEEEAGIPEPTEEMPTITVPFRTATPRRKKSQARRKAVNGK